MTIADVGLRSRGRRALIRVHVVLAIGYAAAMAIALGRAAILAGRPYLPYNNDAVTADVVVWPGLLGFALSWVLILVLALTPTVALAALLVSAVWLAIERRRSDRRLILSTLLTLAVFVCWLTPPSRTVFAWLLD